MFISATNILINLKPSLIRIKELSIEKKFCDSFLCEMITKCVQHGDPFFSTGFQIRARPQEALLSFYALWKFAVQKFPKMHIEILRTNNFSNHTKTIVLNN